MALFSQVADDAVKSKGRQASRPVRRKPMSTRNPYEYDPYAVDDEARPRGVRGLFDRAFGMVGCLAASAALFFGMIYLLGKAAR